MSFCLCGYASKDGEPQSLTNCLDVEEAKVEGCVLSNINVAKKNAELNKANRKKIISNLNNCSKSNIDHYSTQGDVDHSVFIIGNTNSFCEVKFIKVYPTFSVNNTLSTLSEISSCLMPLKFLREYITNIKNTDDIRSIVSIANPRRSVNDYCETVFKGSDKKRVNKYTMAYKKRIERKKKRNLRKSK